MIRNMNIFTIDFVLSLRKASKIAASPAANQAPRTQVIINNVLTAKKTRNCRRNIVFGLKLMNVSKEAQIITVAPPSENMSS